MYAIKNTLIFAIFLNNVSLSQFVLPTFHGAQKNHSSASVVSGTFTFTNCSATGRLGPTQSQVNAAYTSGNSLYNSVTINDQGIQEWTVPSTATYTIEAWGAKGGGDAAGGLGARMKGDFNLTKDDVIKIVIGQMGGLMEIIIHRVEEEVLMYCDFYNSNSSILVIAGGGGGSPGSSDYQSGGSDDGQSGTSGGNGFGVSGSSSGGTNGNGPTSSSRRASAGAGFFTNGANNGQSSSYGTGGKAFVNGSEGGQDLYANSGGGVDGGFGGGGWNGEWF